MPESDCQMGGVLSLEQVGIFTGICIGQDCIHHTLFKGEVTSYK